MQLTEIQTLTNKTLTSPTITGTGAIAGTFTGDVTGDLTGDVTGMQTQQQKIASITNSDIVQLGATQILTNKTLTGSYSHRDRSNCRDPQEVLQEMLQEMFQVHRVHVQVIQQQQL